MGRGGRIEKEMLNGVVQEVPAKFSGQAGQGKKDNDRNFEIL